MRDSEEDDPVVPREVRQPEWKAVEQLSADAELSCHIERSLVAILEASAHPFNRFVTVDKVGGSSEPPSCASFDDLSPTARCISVRGAV